jgi:integrase
MERIKGKPGMYRRGSRVVFSYRENGRQHWGSARTIEEAEDLKAEIRTRIRSGERASRQRTRFEDYAKGWVDAYQGRTTRGFRDSTREGYRFSIEQRAIPFLRKRVELLAQIEPQDVRAFVVWLFDGQDGRKPAVSTVRGHVAALKAMLATAVEDGLIRHNPAAGVRISRPGTPAVELDAREQRRALDSKQLKRFLIACPKDWRLFFELLAMTGLRVGEAVELRWKDVDFGAKRLRVRRRFYRGNVAPPKSEPGSRDIPLSTGMCQRLWRLKGQDDELLFTSVRGQRLDRDWLWKNVLKPTAKKAGVPWVGYHTFRHTCASVLFASGKNPKQVQMWLGHSDPGFTLRTYVHLIDDGLGDADFLDATAWGGVNRVRTSARRNRAKAKTPVPLKVAV